MKRYRVRMSGGRNGQGCDGQPPQFVEIASNSENPPPALGLACPWPKPTSRTLVGWIDRLRAGKVNSNRRSSPNFAVQLNQLLTRPVDTVLCTLLDESSRLPLNSALAHHYPAELLAGIWLMGELTSADNRWIVAEGGTPFRWLSDVREGSAQLRLRMIWVRNDYPQSDPTVLLYTLLNRKLRPGRLPTDQGVLLMDAATAIDIGRCALTGKPADRVPMAFRDHSTGVSKCVLVPAGMTLHQTMAAAGLNAGGKVLRAGDMLRDMRIDGDALAGSSELVIHASLREPAASPDSCIRCGWCLEGCPTRIHPAGLLEASQRRDLNLADHYGLDSCIECGICTYVCPSHLPLLDGIRQLQRQSRQVIERPASGEETGG